MPAKIKVLRAGSGTLPAMMGTPGVVSHAHEFTHPPGTLMANGYATLNP